MGNSKDYILIYELPKLQAKDRLLTQPRIVSAVQLSFGNESER